MIVALFVLVPVVMAAVPMIREQDPMIIAIDDIEGMLFEVPEYDDPKLLEHQLSSMGAMPIFTLLDKSKRLGSSENKENSKTKLFETQNAVDGIMDKLQIIRAKLEKGNSNVYADIQKIIQNLKSLEKIFRPDIRQILSSLKVSLSETKPIALPNTELLKTTQRPAIEERISIDEAPEVNSEIQNQRAISVKVISNGKPVIDKTALFKDRLSDIKPTKLEKSTQIEKINDEERINEEVAEVAEEVVTEENIQATEDPEQLSTYKKRTKNMDDIDSLASYQSNNYVWK